VEVPDGYRTSLLAARPLVAAGRYRHAHPAALQRPTSRPSPAIIQPDAELDEQQSRHVAGLMRINHTGEVCAQALYQGQALTAKLPQVRKAMEHAAEEEIDHLAWCEQRIRQLNSHPSVLNPLFYGMSFGIGALAGLVSDKVSLGFVAATEHQVCKHLDEHLEQIPESDGSPAPSSNRCASTKSTTPNPRWKLAAIASRRPSVSA
jgi:demethoxyubiquinone hydroxylase (CLK1/Coq7/Cat5 family)